MSISWTKKCLIKLVNWRESYWMSELVSESRSELKVGCGGTLENEWVSEWMSEWAGDWVKE